MQVELTQEMQDSPRQGHSRPDQIFVNAINLNSKSFPKKNVVHKFMFDDCGDKYDEKSELDESKSI